MSGQTVAADSRKSMRASPSARFWDRLADRYARKPVPDEAVYQEKLRLTRSQLRPDSEVLEIGCGSGSTALVHAPHVRHVLATDFSARMIEIARRKAVEAGVENVTFERVAIEAFDPPDDSYDAVLALNVLHLVRDLQGALDTLYRTLRPGGVFVSSTVCIGDSLAFFKVVGPIGRWLGLLPDLNVFTTREFEAGLAAAGFAIEHRWLPGKSNGLFVVPRKPAGPASAFSSP